MRRDPGLRHGIWSEDEHDRFLSAIKKYPQGPWSAIAELVGTRSVRQVQTHTQKYYEKIMRRMRGLRKDRKTWARLEHRIDDDILEFCDLMSQSNKAAAASAATASRAAAGSKLASPARAVCATPERGAPACGLLSSVSPRDVAVKCEVDAGVATAGWDALGVYGHPFVLDMDAFGLSSCLAVEPKELPTLEESLDFLIEAMDA